ncbi:MAG: alpha-ketoglutarate-dependent dioxygenase AlkB [Stappiaceae bacterium]
MSKVVLAEGFRLLPGFLDIRQQKKLLTDIRHVAAAAPLFRPLMPKSGKAFSVRMTNCGPLGWVSDKSGYRYQASHPVTGQSWPALPDTIREIWEKLSEFPAPPEACLINFYDEKSRLGLHKDEDEEEFSAPVLSISLGDACLFRIGGLKRSDPTCSFRLSSGDIVILGGGSRLCYHGVDRIYGGTSSLLKGNGRVNLTIRRVTPALTKNEPGPES